jgi:hypothetical protein
MFAGLDYETGLDLVEELRSLVPADLPALSDEVMQRVRELYEERAAPLVHQRW